MAEKTEKATPKKLRDARKKGQVAKSKDFPAAFTFVVALALVVGMSNFFYEQLAEFMVAMFSSINADIDLEHRAGSFMYECLMRILNTSMPIMILVTLIGVLVNFLIIGPLFSMQSMKPDIKKLNPVTNLKNMFKLKTFVELIKSILKIGGAIFLIFTVINGSLPQLVQTAAMPLMGAAMVFADFLMKVSIRVGIFFLAIAVFDLVFQKQTFAKEMKMEKHEVKQEMKDTEGNPEIKGKRRQIAQEIAYQEGPPSVRRARAVVTNPVHIAVALKYDEEDDPAPLILTMGKGLIAEQIIKYALEYEVPIMRNVELAQQLFEEGSISGFIPEDTYSAVAEILRWLAQIEETKEETVLDIFK